MKSTNKWNIQSNQGDVFGVAGQPVVAGKSGLVGDMFLGLVMSFGVGLATAVLLVGMVLLMAPG